MAVNRLNVVFPKQTDFTGKGIDYTRKNIGLPIGLYTQIFS